MSKTELKVGQVWADNDPRAAGRTLRIVEVLPNGAICEVLTDRFHPTPVRSAVGRRTAILSRRFRPTQTGYRLVSES